MFAGDSNGATSFRLTFVQLGITWRVGRSRVISSLLDRGSRKERRCLNMEQKFEETV